MAGERRKIARAAGVVGSLTLASRVTGLLRDAVVGYYFGAGMAAEAFFVAFRFPNLFRRLVAEGAMSVAFVPVFSDLLANRSATDTRRGLRALASTAALALLVMSVGGALAARTWVELFAPGFAGDPDLFRMTVRLTRILFPYLFLIGLVAVFAGFLNASRHFIAPAASPAILNLAIIIFALLARSHFAVPVEALAYGVLAGGVCQVALHVTVLRRHGVSLVPLWEPAHPAVRRSGKLLVPATVGTAIFQLNVLIGTVLASLLPTGSVSYLWYADRVFEFPIGLFAAALGTAALPSMASQAARGDIAAVRDSLEFSLVLMALISVPATMGLMLLAEPIVAVLFQRGAFAAVETEMTASALRAFALGLLPVAAVRLLAPAFYALGDARTPVYAAAGAVLVNIAAGLALMGPVGRVQSAPWLVATIDAVAVFDLGHSGLALATSIAAAVNAMTLALAIAPRIGGFRLWAVVTSSVRGLAASLPMAVAVIGCQYWWTATGAGGRAVGLAVAIVAGVATYGAALFLLGGSEVRRAQELLASRIPARRR